MAGVAAFGEQRFDIAGEFDLSSGGGRKRDFGGTQRQVAGRASARGPGQLGSSPVLLIGAEVLPRKITAQGVALAPARSAAPQARPLTVIFAR